MQKAIEKAAVLIEALPYIKTFHEKFIVIKLGGSVLTDESVLSSVIMDIVFMEQVSMWPILVHGGGPFISAEMKKRGKEPVFVNGHRYTDAETLDIVRSALVEGLGARMLADVHKFNGMGKCIHSGLDGSLTCQRYQPDGEDIGMVGEITEVNTGYFHQLCKEGVIPIVSPLVTDGNGVLHNVNADAVAWKIATELNAEKLVFLSNVMGVLRDINDPDSVISTLPRGDVPRLVQEKVIDGGMIPKTQACVGAVENGVHKTHIVDGNIKHALLVEFFTSEGIGTQIV